MHYAIIEYCRLKIEYFLNLLDSAKASLRARLSPE